MTATKTTSLQKMTAALTEAGWEFTAEQTGVKVPDYDNAYRHSWSGRASHVPLKVVPGVRVVATSNVQGAPKKFTVEFTETGKFLAPNTKGSYPFGGGTPLKDLLRSIEEHGPIATARRVEIRAQEDAARRAQEEREVAEAYAAATQELADARSSLHYVLKMQAGLSSVQVEKVMALLDQAEKGAEESPVAAYFAAKTAVDRTGKGWTPGRTYVSGVYRDGKKVSS